MPKTDAIPASAALIIIDMQKAIDAPYWGPRNNCNECSDAGPVYLVFVSGAP